MLVNMGRLIRQTAETFSQREALVNLERKRRFTYRQMHLLSNRMCHMLKGRFGLQRGDRYVILLENEHVAFFHPWMFKCPVTGVWLDIREGLEQQLKQIDHVLPRVAFVERHFLSMLAEPLAERGIEVVCMDPPGKDYPGVHDFWGLVARASEAEVDEDLPYYDSTRHTAVMRFTGGTTGTPKCAAYSLANFWVWGMNPAHFIHTIPFPHPRVLLFSPINHAASGSLVIPLHLKGGCLATLNRAEVETIGRAVEREGIELIYTVPTVLYRMLDQKVPQRFNLKSLKTIRYGGAPISVAKLEELLSYFGGIFVQGYGSTECWPSCTVLGREDHKARTPEQRARLASIGQPFPGQEILVCDSEGREVTPGEKGELYIRGANTIQGYFRSPELTRENFTPNGFWKSGDIGYRDEEGYFYLVDRKKDMIITGGYNVYATEVENCLNSHPAVADAAVVGIPDETWGEAVQAVVMLRPGASASAEELIAYCKRKLARYKAPKAVHFASELPLSPAGKVLRREVRRRLLQGKTGWHPGQGEDRA